jgi:predicted metal-dependent hydrolase
MIIVSLIDMQRYMIYLKNNSHTPKDAHNLLLRARSLLSASHVVIRDTRVSEFNIEFDITIPDNDMMKDVIGILTSIAPLSEYEHIVERNLPKDRAIEYARSLFNAQKYWLAHEVLESVWKNAQGYEKEILNGIILVAAAFVHEEKDEADICISILKRASKKLEKGAGDYLEVDIDKLKRDVLKIIQGGPISRFQI